MSALDFTVGEETEAIGDEAVDEEGRAVICGVKEPRLVAEVRTLPVPTISAKSSSGVRAVDKRGRSSFATAVARSMKVESGRCTPRVSWIFFCTERTAAREMGVAISLGAATGIASVLVTDTTGDSDGGGVAGAEGAS